MPAPLVAYKMIKSNPGRPPKAWFYKTARRVKRQYPGYGPKRIARIVGGIWHKRYGSATKAKLIRHESGNPGRKISRKAALAALRAPGTPRRLKVGLYKYAKQRGWV